MRWRCSSSCVDALRDRVDLLRARRRDHQRVDGRQPGEPLHCRRIGNQHRIVLVLAEPALTERRERADHGERGALDDAPSGRPASRRWERARRTTVCPSTATFAADATSFSLKNRPFATGHERMNVYVGATPVIDRLPVVLAGDDLRAQRDRRRDRRDARKLGDRQTVGGRQASRRRRSRCARRSA